MPRWKRDIEDVRLDIAHAFGEGEDPVEYLRRRHEREWAGGGG